MNIFIMILLAVFMVGYYAISSPSNRLPVQETQTAVKMSDMRSIAECATAMHNAFIKKREFNDICVEQNGIKSDFICLNSGKSVIPCVIQNKRKPEYSYIITATAPLPYDEYNDMMDILEKYYADAGTFGILQDGAIVSGGTTFKRTMPKSVIKQLELTDGQLVYMTQYEIPDEDKDFIAPDAQVINCPAGTAKTYRFGRWQCVAINTKTDCAGDTVWNYEADACIPDESRKPLCATTQTAVIIDDVWECIDPFIDATCPANMVARLNYDTLEWECVADPDYKKESSKCAHAIHGAIRGRPGATLRMPPASCTDCEKLVVNEDTCEAACIPDVTKLKTRECYPGNIQECSGPHRSVFFGFPSISYVNHVPDVKGINISIDNIHNQNRRFNCMDCGDSIIDTDKSVFPYTAVCK